MKRKAKKALEAELEQEQKEIAPVCKNCRHYGDKKCGVTGNYTARKQTCGSIKLKEAI